jgi:crossover junction endodeoxyribonuclease RuvC
MRVLGIDPGSRRTGFAVVEREGSRLRPLAWGTIALGDGALPDRLRTLYLAIEALVAEHGPTTVAVEGIFHAKNAGSALKLGHARGVALLVASLHELEVHEYAPAVVKRAVTSSGRADKTQVQYMVRLLLGLAETPEEDAADALAVAICHAQAARLPLPSPSKEHR